MAMREDIGTVPGPLKELEDMVINSPIIKNDPTIIGDLGANLTWYITQLPVQKQIYVDERNRIYASPKEGTHRRFVNDSHKELRIISYKQHVFPDKSRLKEGSKWHLRLTSSALFTPYWSYISVTGKEHDDGWSLGYWDSRRLFKIMEKTYGLRARLEAVKTPRLKNINNS